MTMWPHMSRDVNPVPHDCIVLPPRPQIVSVFDMKPMAVQLYLNS